MKTLRALWDRFFGTKPKLEPEYFQIGNISRPVMFVGEPGQVEIFNAWGKKSQTLSIVGRGGKRVTFKL